MSLTTCRECNGEISTHTNICPKCGANQRRAENEAKSDHVPKWFSYAWNAILLIFFIGIVFVCVLSTMCDKGGTRRGQNITPQTDQTASSQHSSTQH